MKKPSLMVPLKFCEFFDSADLTLNEKITLAHGFITQREKVLINAQYTNAQFEWSSIKKLFGKAGYKTLSEKGYLERINKSFVKLTDANYNELNKALDETSKTDNSSVELVAWLESKVTVDDMLPTFDEKGFLALYDDVKALKAQVKTLQGEVERLRGDA